MTTAKLSKVQRHILTRAAERPGTGQPHGAGCESPTRADCMMRDLLPDNPTRAQRASLARAVSRLVARGLVTRRHWWFQRESGISLTPAGRETVSIVNEGPIDNRFSGGV